MLTNGILELIPAAPELAEALTDFHRRNRVFFRPYHPARTEDFFTVEHQRQLLETYVTERQAKRGDRFYIRLCGQQEIIGDIGLSNVVWGAFQSAHLGYQMDEQQINHGYMTMAVRLVTDYAFHELNLHRIEANVMPGNVRSLRVLEKCGYENEGLSKAYLKINGRWEDHIHMVKLHP